MFAINYFSAILVTVPTEQEGGAGGGSLGAGGVGGGRGGGDGVGIIQFPSYHGFKRRNGTLYGMPDNETYLCSFNIALVC